MSLSAGQVMITQTKCLYAGEFAVSTFYHTLETDDPIDIDAYFTSMYGVFTEYLPPLMVLSAQLVQVKSWLRGNPNPFETRIYNTALPGEVAGEGLPPFVSATLIEMPFNATRWPSGAQAFRPGRVALTGIPESAQVGGVMESSYRAVLQDLGDAILSVADNSGFGPQLKLFLDRTYPVKTSTGLARCYVETVQAGRIGTQNTRKS